MSQMMQPPVQMPAVPTTMNPTTAVPPTAVNPPTGQGMPVNPTPMQMDPDVQMPGVTPVDPVGDGPAVTPGPSSMNDDDPNMMDDQIDDPQPIDPGDGDVPAESSCLAGITDFGSAGPFDFTADRAGSINFWVPQVPAGCKVPVIHLANGTGARCSNYGPALERMASHGFLAACYENTNTGAGTQGLEALQTAVSMYPDLVAMRFGSTGHSQGGQASFVVLQYAEKEWGDDAVYAGLAMQPASGFGSQPREGWRNVYSMIKSPMFMFSGQGSDGLVSQGWVQDGFNALSDDIEAYHWAKQGGRHIPVPNGEEMEISIPWFRWKLLGDQAACKAFKAIREDRTWTEAAVQNEAPCM